ncbi:MAG: putative glycoside hydrolase [Candidatus Eiseniibacteriota bacterium]|jgi:hypothetical protein
MVAGLLLAGAPPSPASPAPLPDTAVVAPDTAVAALLGPRPELYFDLLYCGSGRPRAGQSQLDAVDLDTAASRFGFTILRRHVADYRKVARSLRRRAPNQTIALYRHAHALYAYEDRAGVLNLYETNYLHGTDPAALMATKVDGTVRVDWMPDERPRYDAFDTISPSREFGVSGYVVLRGAPGEPLAPIARLPHQVTAFVDSTAAPGIAHHYRVDVIQHQGHQLPFSHEVVASPAAGIVVRDLERVVSAAVDSARYLLRIRFAVEPPTAMARLLIDRNSDRDVDDAGERLAFAPTGDGRLEVMTELDAASRAADTLHRIIGFSYRIEVEAPDGTRLELPAHGSFTTSVNQRIRHRRYGFYIMWPDTDPWIDYQLRQLRQELGRRVDVNAVFLDELVIDPHLAADADPVELTTAGFQQASVRLLALLHDRRPDLAFYYNGAGEGVDPPAAAGGMLEGFCVASWYRGGSAADYAPPTLWETQVQAALGMAAAGRELLLLARDRPLGDRRARLYALASFHLVRGAGTRFCFRTRPCGTPALPEWEIDLGAPLESFRRPEAALVDVARPGLYRRRFAHGEVWVNALADTSRTVVIDPPAWLVELVEDAAGAGVELRITRRVAHLELAPQSGALLLRPPAAP